MANIIRIGLLLATLSIITILVQPTEADEHKKKRVVIKVPARIKHVYHHHTKKIHIYKKKPKTKPVSEHVVHEHIEEESQVRPVKSWKYKEYKKKPVGDRYKRRPKNHYEYRPTRGYSSAESQESVIEEDYYPLEDDYVPKRRPRRPREDKKTSRGKKKYRTKKPKVDYIDDYEDKVWPERKEHPSWHQKTWSPAVTEEPEEWVPKETREPAFRSQISHIPDGSVGYRPRDHKSQVSHVPEESVDYPQDLPGSGYRSQINHGPDGSSYRSQVGHSSDSSKPSSSFQSVSFGQIKKKA